jgi:hypothetical protein
VTVLAALRLVVRNVRDSRASIVINGESVTAMSGATLAAFFLLLALLSIFRRGSFSLTARIKVIPTSARFPMSRRLGSNRAGFRYVTGSGDVVITTSARSSMSVRLRGNRTRLGGVTRAGDIEVITAASGPS